MRDHDWTSPGTPADEKALARQNLIDDHSAARVRLDEKFASFYRSTIRPLVAFLLNHGASLPLATDIAQDAMIETYRRWTTIDNPRAYVHRTASRALIRAITEVREEPAEQVPEPTPLLPHPDAAMDWELRHDLLPLLRTLPPRQRQVLAWTLSGFTPAEIAAELRMTSNAVSASLKKARRAATRYLAATGYLAGDKTGKEER